MSAGSRRRIVLVNQYFPPDTAATARIAADFVAECGRVGTPVTVVCGYPSYEPPSRPGWRPLRRTRNGTTTVIVVGSTGFGRARPVGRVVDYMTFLLGAAVVMPFVSARAACVVMTNPPMAPLLAWSAQRAGRAASVDVWMQDLHPDFGVAAGLLRNGVLVRVWRRALLRALAAADGVEVLGRDMAARLAELGVTTPTEVVHNGWAGVTAAPASNRRDGVLRVMYFGNVGFAGPWESVVGAANQLVGKAEFVFVGGGVADDALDGATAGNVTRVERVPHDQVPAMAADADLLLVGVRAGIEGYVVPSKGYEMMALGRPLLVVGNPASEMRLLIEELQCGFGADDDAASIVDAVTRADRNRAAFAAMEKRAIEASHQFTRARQFDPLIERLSSLTADR